MPSRRPAQCPFSRSRPAREESERWPSEVGHGAIDVGVAGGGEVQLECRFLEGDHTAGGDVESTARALAAAASRTGQAGDGRVQRNCDWTKAAEPRAPTKTPAPSPLPPFAAEPPSAAYAHIARSSCPVMVADDVSVLPKMLPMPTPCRHRCRRRRWRQCRRHHPGLRSPESDVGNGRD